MQSYVYAEVDATLLGSLRHLLVAAKRFFRIVISATGQSVIATPCLDLDARGLWLVQSRRVEVRIGRLTSQDLGSIVRHAILRSHRTHRKNSEVFMRRLDPVRLSDPDFRRLCGSSDRPSRARRALTLGTAVLFVLLGVSSSAQAQFGPGGGMRPMGGGMGGPQGGPPPDKPEGPVDSALPGT